MDKEGKGQPHYCTTGHSCYTFTLRKCWVLVLGVMGSLYTVKIISNFNNILENAASVIEIETSASDEKHSDTPYEYVIDLNMLCIIF